MRLAKRKSVNQRWSFSSSFLADCRLWRSGIKSRSGSPPSQIHQGDRPEPLPGEPFFGKFGDLRPGAGGNVRSATGNLCSVESFVTQQFGEHASDRKRAKTLKVPFPLFEVNWSRAQVPVQQTPAPDMEIKAFLSKRCGRENVRPKWSVECSS